MGTHCNKMMVFSQAWDCNLDCRRLSQEHHKPKACMGDRQVEGQLGQLSEALSQTKKSFVKKKEEVGHLGPL